MISLIPKKIFPVNGLAAALQMEHLSYLPLDKSETGSRQEYIF